MPLQRLAHDCYNVQCLVLMEMRELVAWQALTGTEHAQREEQYMHLKRLPGMHLAAYHPLQVATLLLDNCSTRNNQRMYSLTPTMRNQA